MAANKESTTETQSQSSPVVSGDSKQPAGQQSGTNGTKRLLKYVASFLLIALVLVAGWHLYQNSRDVVIGKITITPKQVNALSDEMVKYGKQYKNVSFGKSPHDTARNYLILNAALKTEADKYHIKVTQADMNKTQPVPVGPGGTVSYQLLDSYDDAQQVLLNINAENAVYEAKLQDKEIAKKDLLVAAIIYDTPYVNNSTNPTPTALRQQALATMKTKFLPLFRQNKSDKDIIAQVNINPAKHITSGSGGTYFNSMPSAAFYAKGCTSAKPCFNDIKSKPVSGLPAPVSTQSQIDKLTKVGQNTGVFNSEAGFVGIMRLVGKTSGSYDSWDQFLQHYENKYADGRLMASSLLPLRQINLASTFITHQVATTLHFADSLLWKKAAANPSCTNNSAHFVALNIHAYDQNGGNLSGATVTETRNNANCPNQSGRYVDDQVSLPNHGPNGGSTNSNGLLTLNDNCYNSPPDWSQNGPPGYHLTRVHVYDSLGDDATMIVGQNFNGTITEQNAIGKAVADSGIWSNGILNAAGSLTVELHYSNPPPPNTWSLNGTTTVNGQSGTITKQPGESVTFSHTVHNNGPSTATYSWVIKDSNGGGYSGTGTNSGGNINVGSGNNGPNGYTKTYSIPNNAQNGDTYCQRIDYTNANGPTTSTQNSTPACVVVQTGGGGGTHSLGCSATTYSVSHQGGHRQYIDIIGTDSDGSYYVAPDGSGNDSISLSYTALAKTVHVKIHRYTWNGSAWVEDSGSPVDHSYGCYHSYCTVTSVQGDGPGNIVLAGHPFKVFVTVTNDNTDPSAETIPVNAGGHDFSITEGPDDYQGGYVHNPTGFSANPPSQPGGGQPVGPKEIDFSGNGNSSQVRQMTLNFFPDLANYDNLGAGCSTTLNIYQQFSVSVSAQSDLSPTTEHPSNDQYGASANFTWNNPPGGLSNHGVNDTISASFYKRTAGGATSNPCSPSSYSSGGPFTIQSNPTVLSGNCSIPKGTYQAGDEYCTTVSSQYSSGYVGPDNGVVSGTGPATDTKCPRVVNEPYFKVYNSDISAGGAFDKCTSDGGTLAGYADINDPSGATRGSTTQLGALALLKIIGVASAKTSADITGSPAKLTFANDSSEVQVDSTGNESPVLGGQFGGTDYSNPTACRTLTNETMPPAATNYGSSTFNIFGRTGAWQHNGNLTINGGTLANKQNLSMFVTGDVYIASNIAYGNNWQAGTAPSIVVHATGNIYISPNVRKLAGVYIAQDDSSGNKGKIYTCASTTNHFSAMQPAQLYNGCRNQLIVAGNLVAKQINLMRTFGSLRDEEPNPGTPGGTPVIDLTWSSCGSPGAGLPGESCPTSSQLASLRCTAVNEPSDPNGWFDNKICVPSSSSVHLYWTHCENYPGCDQSASSIAADPGALHLSSIQNGIGTPGGTKYPYCTQWNVPDPNTWGDNWLCSDQKIGLNFSSVGGVGCVKVNELADHDASWSSGYYQCVDTSGATGPTPTGPPYAGCSNKTTPSQQTDSISCAGEIFEYSPTLYLSRPVVNPPAGGSIQFQSITSLPPVL